MKRNFKFARELKCDGYAATNKQDFHHLIDGLAKLNNARKEKARSLNGVNALVGKKDELVDRLTVMAMRWEESRRKWRLLTNVGYSVVIVWLFFASYSFIVLPAHFESPYVSAYTEGFIWEESEYGDIFHVPDIFLVDNGDGTFSYYVGGNFMMYVDADSDILQWVDDIRTRESE